MTERRRRYDGAGRKPWPWYQRLGDLWYRLVVAPFMTRIGNNGDTIVIGSMTRWSVFLFTIAETARLAPIWIHTPNGWVVTMTPLGWPDVAETFVILYALGIDKAINNAQPKDVLDLVGKVLPGGATASQSMTAPDGTTMTQVAPGAPAPVVPATDIPEAG